MNDNPLNATIVARQDLNEMLAIFHVRPDSGQAPSFEPGQFTTLGVLRDAPGGAPADERPPLPGSPAAAAPQRPRLIRRAYSIASSPLDRDKMEFYLVLVPEGRLTPRLWRFKVGDRLWLDDQVKGEFTLARVPTGRNLLMMSTGTGIAPFISMLRTFRDTGRWRKLVMVNGVRQSCDLGYCEELEAEARRDPNFVYIPIVSREPEGGSWRGMRGRVQSVLADGVYQKLTGCDLNPADTHALLCGNPQMITDVQALLESRGFVVNTHNQPGNIHYERYW